MKKLSFFAFSLLAACHARPDPVPSEANTFSCLIDNKAFTPYLAPSSQPFTGPKIPALNAIYVAKEHILVLEARDVYNQISIGIHLTPGVGTGTYSLGYSRLMYPFSSTFTNYGTYTSIPPFVSGVTDPNNLPPVLIYTTDAVNKGSLSLTRLDTIARTAAGTFTFAAREPTMGQITHLTSGQFDVTF
ncbi:MAG: hypothetical protein EOO60_09555 [Hymenobacter sp.]|nr:MAG: hypothetical protein EOO60_09555 [Hymenobacter sp.]